MTRANLLTTENGKTATDMRYRSADGYPSGLGLELLNAIQQHPNNPEMVLAVFGERPVSFDEEPIDLANYDCLVPPTVKLDGVETSEDYTYVWHTKTNKLWVRHFGDLLYVFDLNTQMDVCRAFFQHDFLLGNTMEVDEATLFVKYSGVYKQMRSLAKAIKSEDELLQLIASKPDVCIKHDGCVIVGGGYKGDCPFEHQYRVCFRSGEGKDMDWGYSTNECLSVAICPQKTRYGETYRECKKFAIYVSTPFGRCQIGEAKQPGGGKLMSMKAAKQFLSQWVRGNAASIKAYTNAFKVAREGLMYIHRSLAVQEDITCERMGEEGRKVIEESMAKITAILDGVKPICNMPAEEMRRLFTTELRDAIWRIANRDKD